MHYKKLYLRKLHNTSKISFQTHQKSCKIYKPCKTNFSRSTLLILMKISMMIVMIKIVVTMIMIIVMMIMILMKKYVYLNSRHLISLIKKKKKNYCKKPSYKMKTILRMHIIPRMKRTLLQNTMDFWMIYKKTMFRITASKMMMHFKL